MFHELHVTMGSRDIEKCPPIYSPNSQKTWDEYLFM